MPRTTSAVPNFTYHLRHHVGIEALESHRLEARHGEARRRWQEHEVTCLERQRRVAINCQATATFQHRAEARVTERGVADTPAAGAADAPREHGPRLEQRDDFREWIGHVWTLANEIRTLHGRESGAIAVP